VILHFRIFLKKKYSIKNYERYEHLFLKMKMNFCILKILFMEYNYWKYENYEKIENEVGVIMDKSMI